MSDIAYKSRDPRFGERPISLYGSNDQYIWTCLDCPEPATCFCEACSSCTDCNCIEWEQIIRMPLDNMIFEFVAARNKKILIEFNAIARYDQKLDNHPTEVYVYTAGGQKIIKKIQSQFSWTHDIMDDIESELREIMKGR